MNHSGSWNIDVDLATVDVVVDTVLADFDSIVGPGFVDDFTFDFTVDVVIVVLVVDVDVVGIDVDVEVSVIVLSSGMDVKNRIAE